VRDLWGFRFRPARAGGPPGPGAAGRGRARAGRGARAARAAGGDYTPRPVEKPMPPQVIHALAGARYRTRRYLESPEADDATGFALVEAAEQREADAAARIAARPPLPPLPEFHAAPEIPMIPPEQARRA
ncbi:MAG: hypothetical protein KC472_09330, partial [Dehalococcoidia bacterium]|nr:hypothetical protein [Dehalococcoidia bacterium]